jgi:hypothetical protein
MQGWGEDNGLLPTTVSALRDPAVSALFDLAPVDRGSDGYVLASEFGYSVTNFGLLETPRATVNRTAPSTH